MGTGISSHTNQQTNKSTPAWLFHNKKSLHASSTKCPTSPLSLLFLSNQYIKLLLKSFHMQDVTFLKVLYSGRNYPESQVNLLVPLSGRCVTLYQGSRCQLSSRSALTRICSAVPSPCDGSQWTCLANALAKPPGSAVWFHCLQTREPKLGCRTLCASYQDQHQVGQWESLVSAELHLCESQQWPQPPM